MVRYAVESFEECIPELKMLSPGHYDEVEDDNESIRLDPDWDRYIALEKSDILLFITVRDDEELIGYLNALIMPHLHCRTSLTAFTDMFFLLPERREQGIGIGLFRYAIDTVRLRGVQRMFITCKLSHDLDPLMVRLGFKEIERVYSMIFITEDN